MLALLLVVVDAAASASSGAAAAATGSAAAEAVAVHAEAARSLTTLLALTPVVLRHHMAPAMTSGVTQSCVPPRDGVGFWQSPFTETEPMNMRSTCNCLDSTACH